MKAPETCADAQPSPAPAVVPARSTSIAVVHGEPVERRAMGSLLRERGFRVQEFGRVATFLSHRQGADVDIAIVDLGLGESDGTRLLAQLARENRSTDVVVVVRNAGPCCHCDLQKAWKQGAFSYLASPVETADLIGTVERALAHRATLARNARLEAHLSHLANQDAERWGLARLIGKSRAFQEILKDIERAQRAPNAPVLITGESGTGKELVARAIHFSGPRSHQPFIPINCSAVPGELAESLFFGHVRGSFTGATESRPGCFQLAEGGTLFLDEISDMPSGVQPKLLGVLDGGPVVPVGGKAGQALDLRVIAATNADLRERIASHAFREDLFYRLAVFTITVPPLRERREEIPMLTEHFISLFAREMGIPVPALSDTARDRLCSHSYPGNIRELKNVIERALMRMDRPRTELDAAHIRFDVDDRAARDEGRHTPPRMAADRVNVPLNLRMAESEIVRLALERSRGNLSAAARLLGIERTKVYRLLQTLPERPA